MKIKLDGKYGTQQHPDYQVTIYCVDGPGLWPVHGRLNNGPESWSADGKFHGVAYSLHSLVPLQAEPPTKPSVNWDHIAEDWISMALDEGGSVWFYTTEPHISADSWVGSNPVRMQALASLDAGTCDWQESVVMRPPNEK
jgi:hypothetical protein